MTSDTGTPASAELRQEIKQLIVDCLDLQDVLPDDIQDAQLLFADNDVIELDSVDALEIVVALQNRYGVRINDQNLARNVVQTVNSIAEFVAQSTASNAS